MHPYHIIHLNEVGSTNTFARQALAEGTILPNAAIVAATQVAGRGQVQTTWHDEPGKNLLLTLVVQPKHLKAMDYFKLNMAVSVALAEAIAPFAATKIKWPNDIVLGTEKLAGILIETAIQGDKIHTAFIGIGLNVNQVHFASGLRATSLMRVCEREFNLPELRDAVLGSLHARLSNLESSQMAQAYEEKLFGLGENLRFSDKNGEFMATVKGVSKDGTLLLHTLGEENWRTYRFKEVVWRLA